MKKLLAALSVLLIGAMLCAFAEQTTTPPVSIDMFLGVWEAVEDPGLTLTILPGNYTPYHAGWSQTDFYAEGCWHDPNNMDVFYRLNVGSIESATPAGFGGLLSMAFDSFKQIMIEKEDSENGEFSMLEYKDGIIDVVEEYNTELWEQRYFEDTTGSLYTFYSVDDALMLFWMDSKDPHIMACNFTRKTVDAPTPEALTEGVVRPILDMTDDTQAQTALSLMRFAVDNRLALADSAQLAENLSAATDALSDSEARVFGSKYDKIDALLAATATQIPNLDTNEHHYPAFEESGLEKEVICLLNFNVTHRRSAELLCDALHTLVYGE